MELNDLRHFRHVALAASFTRGAKASHVTVPAISKAVRRLETELGKRLFLRTTRQVALTDAGRALLARTDRVLAELDAVRADLDGDDGRIAGEIRVGAMEVLSIYVLPRALAALVAEHPHVVPYTHELVPERMERLIAEGRLDVGFTIGGGAHPALDYTLLGRSPGVLVCGRRHPLARRRRVSARDLLEHASVVPRFLDLEQLPVLDQFPEHRQPRRIGATIELLQMGVALVIEGAYLGWFPEMSVRPYLADGRLVPLAGVRGARPFELRAITRRGGPERAVVRLLVAGVRQAVRSGLTRR